MSVLDLKINSWSGPDRDKDTEVKLDLAGHRMASLRQSAGLQSMGDTKLKARPD